MKSKRVTSTWEFYRDNCEGFKEPMRKELRKLDGYVANIEAENSKLRVLVRDLWHELDAATQYEAGGSRGIVFEFADAMRKLGIEVDA